MNSTRITTFDRIIARLLFKGLRVGEQYAFIDLNKIDHQLIKIPQSTYSSLSNSENQHETQPARITIPIRHGKRLKLPGVDIEAFDPPDLLLRSLTCDRDLYQCNRDQVNVFVIDLDSPNCEVGISLSLENSDLGRPGI